jgi:hypothetical protein
MGTNIAIKRKIAAAHKFSGAKTALLLWRRRRQAWLNYPHFPERKSKGRSGPILEGIMTETKWTAAEACEIRVGMEVTANLSGEI